jgi:DNA repair photolyase
MRHGSHLDPPNRFERVSYVEDLEQVAADDDYLVDKDRHPIECIDDLSESIVSENDSPDLPFRYSLNPYRGCIHGCSYCYARNTHEYLGWNAGIDFETKIIVKRHAPELLRKFLSRDRWQPELISFSGVTDCYQPVERQFRLTRGCLEVAVEANQPISIITKNALVERDVDLLQQLATKRLTHVFVSLNSLNAELARKMEPRTSTPSARLRAISVLAEANIPVGVMVAPVIPGLNDSEIPEVLAAAKQAGASMAGYQLLRLPLTVEPVFFEWLTRCYPDRVERVVERIKATREGKLSEASFGKRFRGAGFFAEQIENLFRLFARKHGLDKKPEPLATDLFKPPLPTSGQLRLF